MLDDKIKPITTPIIKIFDKNNNTIYLKDETKQFTGAFKYRGVYNKFKEANLSKYNGVITASTGNHALAVSLLARKIGIKCYVVIPNNTPKIKKEKIRSNSAIIFDDSKLKNYDMCVKIAKQKAQKYNLLYIPSFDDIDIINGHKTMFEELPFQKIDYCFCPVGGGGLVSAAILSKKLINTKIIGVELEGFSAMKASLKYGTKTKIKIENEINSFCEGILVSEVGNVNFNIAYNHNLEINTVSKENIKSAIGALNKIGIKSEGAGAASYAAYLNSNISNSTILCIISGGNIDDELYTQIVGSEL